MYNTFFGFRERPFKLVPNPQYLYLSPSHEEALAHLKYAVTQGEGFVEITGEVGTGKTMLCRAFLESASEEISTAYIFNPRLSAKELLQAINTEFGIASDLKTVRELIGELNAFLIRKKAEGGRAVLVIDEAQNLGNDVLEQLRLLSNLETTREKLLQMILVGQPELGRILESREMRQLAQRISLSCSILPLSFEDTGEYIIHRIHVASPNPRVYFTRRAVRRIYRYSGGIPRLVNIVCDRALVVAFSGNFHRITSRVVKKAVYELEHAGKGRLVNQKARVAAIFALAVSAAALTGAWWFYGPNMPEFSGFVNMVSSKTPNPGESEIKSKQTVKIRLEDPESGPLDLVRGLGPDSLESAASAAVSMLTDKADLPDSADNSADRYLRRAAEKSGLELLRVENDLSLIRNLGQPAVFSFEQPATQQPIYLAALGYRNGKLEFYHPGTGKTNKILQQSAAAVWKGTAWVFWKNPREIEGVIGRDAGGDSVAGLQILLKAAGRKNVTVNGTYDEKTRTAIKEIQAGHGLPVDGYGNDPTKIVLYRLAGARTAGGEKNE